LENKPSGIDYCLIPEANIFESTVVQFTRPLVYLEVIRNAACLFETDPNTVEPIIGVNSLKNVADQTLISKNEIIFGKSFIYQRQNYVA